MLAILTAPTFDPLGSVHLHVLPDSANWERRRRVSRVATLDGGAAINDGGYAVADQTVTLRWPVRDATTGPAVQRMVQQHARLTLSIGGSLYEVVAEAYTPGADTDALTLLIAAQLAPQ